MGLAGAKVLVVGASAGIGRAVALELARRDADVAVAARRVERLKELVDEANAGHPIELDVTIEQSVVDATKVAVDALGGLDVVVYASGVASMRAIVDETTENWRRMFETNVVGAALVARECIPHLDPGGVMFCCSSTNTHRRLWGLTGYGATKAAFDRLIEGLRDEHPKVRFVRSVIGQTIGTEFGNSFDGAMIGEAMPRWVVSGRQCAGMMQPPELAEVIVDVLATLRSHPAIEIPELPLDPAGGPLLLPPTPDVLATAFQAMGST